ncbi:MAG: sigma-70 family RNA polymerase sigma factor [Deltaproteobacteria bacterium]|nr:sigma-70 family RNA polymerase sigma factor [Deltaproteobacteria bacterium]
MASEARGALLRLLERPATDAFDWDAAIRCHHRRLCVSLLALGLTIDQAEDVAHQAWLRIIERQRAGLLRELRLPGLVIVQARFLALNLLRRGRRDTALPEGPGDSQPLAVDDVDPENRLISRERLDSALRVLAGCSESARAVFQLVYSDPPLGHAEVAQRLGLSVQRVRQILCEVRAKMRSAVEGSP